MLLLLDGRLVFRRLLQIALILAASHLIVVIGLKPGLALVRLFDLGSESNLPTWFSSLVWLFAAIAARQCSECETGSLRRAWLLIAAALLFLSLDEAAMLHERAAVTLAENLPASARQTLKTKFWATEWVIVAAPV